MSARLPELSDYWACRPIASPGNPATVRRLFVSLPDPAVLESVSADGAAGRWSYYAFSPVATIRSTGNDGVTPDELFARLRDRIGRPPASIPANAPPFLGGWIGHLSYEAGRWIEPKAGWRHAPTPFGLAEWRFYDTILAHDVVADRWYVTGVDAEMEREGASSLRGRLDRLEARLAAHSYAAESDEFSSDACATGDWNMSADEYLRRVERILDYIRAGDIYQANLTRRFKATLETDAARLYDALCRHNPAAYAAFIRFDDGGATRTIQSSSPELFLTLSDGVVTTRPIKGTRPRSGDVDADAVAVAELQASEKERAELNMIIDLERNDLGRVCEYGSIRVDSAGDIETFPTVFHRTATVRGQLREDCDAIDLIRATFPGGSITGAPKVRAMQIINELEDEARGPYCGAIGYIGVGGHMQLNLPIRTLTTIGDRVELAVGSGIVADSDPLAELEELNAKARGMMRAIAQCQQRDDERETLAGNGAGATRPLAAAGTQST